MGGSSPSPPPPVLPPPAANPPTMAAPQVAATGAAARARAAAAAGSGFAGTVKTSPQGIEGSLVPKAGVSLLGQGGGSNQFARTLVDTGFVSGAF